MISCIVVFGVSCLNFFHFLSYFSSQLMQCIKRRSICWFECPVHRPSKRTLAMAWQNVMVFIWPICHIPQMNLKKKNKKKFNMQCWYNFQITPLFSSFQCKCWKLNELTLATVNGTLNIWWNVQRNHTVCGLRVLSKETDV